VSHFSYCYAERHYAVCRYVEYRYTECRGVIKGSLVRRRDINLVRGFDEMES
jgi:hypothetical protein